MLSSFLGGNNVQTLKPISVPSDAELRLSIFPDDYWSALRRTRIYKTTKLNSGL
jgi:hypothetical protein